MLNKIKLLVPVIAVLFLSGFMKSDTDIYFQMSKGLDTFGKVYKEVSLNYVDEINPEEFMIAGIEGMLSSLDPYTVYVDENLQKDVDVITKGKYGGIGATIGLRKDEVTVVELIDGYSAQRQGMRIGDVIVEIDGTEISEENYEELSSFMKGKPGSVVSVKVKRDGDDETITFNLVREEVEVKNLAYYGFVPEGSGNAYLKLVGFSRTAGEEVKQALIDLKSKGEIKSIILDLRGNPGGLLDAAIDVSDKFLAKDQVIVTVKGRTEETVKTYKSTEEPLAGEAKLVVLIDNSSASASEIVAGAIQDHDRGVILGTHSFGKGLVQTLVPLSYNTSLKITTAKYYTPSGRCIQKIDYSKENEVFNDPHALVRDEFETDNKRKVYSAGGIMPDTLVTDRFESQQMRSLLAQGMFFQFATNYFNAKDDLKLKNINDEKLFTSFVEYLNENKFEYKLQAEKLVEELKKLAVKENYDEEFKQAVAELETDVTHLKKEELSDNKDEILAEIKQELAARIGGLDARVVESIKHDSQFDTAFNILRSEVDYHTLLAFAE